MGGHILSGRAHGDAPSRPRSIDFFEDDPNLRWNADRGFFYPDTAEPDGAHVQQGSADAAAGSSIDPWAHLRNPADPPPVNIWVHPHVPLATDPIWAHLRNPEDVHENGVVYIARYTPMMGPAEYF